MRISSMTIVEIKPDFDACFSQSKFKTFHHEIDARKFAESADCDNVMTVISKHASNPLVYRNGKMVISRTNPVQPEQLQQSEQPEPATA